MELDDLKNTWDDIQNQVGKQQNINLKMIDKMTHSKYNTRMKKIVYPEVFGTITCLIGAVYIVLNFYKLNTILSQVLGIILVLFLLILPVISLTFLWQFNKIGDVGKPYVETLKKFAAQKIRFYKYQQASVILSYILLGFFVIIAPKFVGGKDITDNKYFWAFALAFSYVFLFIFSKWVLKCYSKTLQQTEELLKDLTS